MSVRIGQLEDKIENELVELVREQGGLIHETKHALSACTTLLHDVGTVLGQLKQSTPSIRVQPDSEVIVRGRQHVLGDEG